MGHRSQKRHRLTTKSHTLPSSPTHSSSSSDFEFTVPLSPRKSSADLRPADELFYKGKLLPLHLSPRLSMVRTLLLSSSSTSSSSDTTTTASRASTSSSSGDCDSSRPSSAADEDTMHHPLNPHRKPPSKYFSIPKFSSVFRKTTTPPPPPPPSSGAATVKSIIRKYFKKVKPFYEKLSHKVSPPPPPTAAAAAAPLPSDDIIQSSISHSFSGNLRCPRRTTCFSSCPSSIGSSPTHGRNGSGFRYGLVSESGSGSGSGMFNSDASSMEELQNAIQGAILHCKNSMLQNRV